MQRHESRKGFAGRAGVIPAKQPAAYLWNRMPYSISISGMAQSVQRACCTKRGVRDMFEASRHFWPDFIILSLSRLAFCRE